MRARREKLGQENNGQVFNGIHPKGGRRRTAPRVFTLLTQHLRFGWIDHYRKAQTKANSIVSSLREKRSPALSQVHSPWKVIRGHELKRFSADDSATV